VKHIPYTAPHKYARRADVDCDTRTHFLLDSGVGQKSWTHPGTADYDKSVFLVDYLLKNAEERRPPRWSPPNISIRLHKVVNLRLPSPTSTSIRLHVVNLRLPSPTLTRRTPPPFQNPTSLCDLRGPHPLVAERLRN
jgi:hypothetical protein